MPAVQTMLGGLPILAVDALGTTIVAGVGERLFIADVAAKRVRQLPGLPSDKGTAQLSGIRFTPQGDLCLFRTDTNTRRSASCEASHLIEVRAGRRRAMSLLDACVEVGDSAARVSFPPPPRGRRFIEGSFFGPRGICAVGVTPDGSHAVRLETDAAGTALSLIGRHRATPDTRDEVALPKGESPLTDAHFDLSPRGDRVALWRMGDLLLIDTAKRSVLAQRTNSNPGEFTHEGKLVFDRYQDELLMDRDGKAAFAWPDKDSQDAAAVRCVVDGKLQRCAAP